MGKPRAFNNSYRWPSTARLCGDTDPCSFLQWKALRLCRCRGLLLPPLWEHCALLPSPSGPPGRPRLGDRGPPLSAGRMDSSLAQVKTQLPRGGGCSWTVAAAEPSPFPQGSEVPGWGPSRHLQCPAAIWTGALAEACQPGLRPHMLKTRAGVRHWKMPDGEREV